MWSAAATPPLLFVGTETVDSPRTPFGFRPMRAYRIR